MRKNRAAWLAWALCGLGIVLAGYGLLVTRRAAGAPADGWDIANIVLNAGFVVVFGMVGALIVSRQPRNTIGWP